MAWTKWFMPMQKKNKRVNYDKIHKRKYNNEKTI